MDGKKDRPSAPVHHAGKLPLLLLFLSSSMLSPLPGMPGGTVVRSVVGTLRMDVEETSTSVRSLRASRGMFSRADGLARADGRHLAMKS